MEASVIQSYMKIPVQHDMREKGHGGKEDDAHQEEDAPCFVPFGRLKTSVSERPDTEPSKQKKERNKKKDRSVDYLITNIFGNIIGFLFQCKIFL